MIPDFDKNAAYIWATYGLGGFLIVSTLIWVWFAARGARQKLERLETEAP